MSPRYEAVRDEGKREMGFNSADLGNRKKIFNVCSSSRFLHSYNFICLLVEINTPDLLYLICKIGHTVC